MVFYPAPGRRSIFWEEIMTNLLLRVFLKHPADSAKGRSAIGSLSGTVGIFCNILLFAMKLIIGILSGAVSITADALNNLSDASGSVVTLIGFRLAGKPADAHHPYGHARAEYLSGLAVAVMILFIGFELAKSSVQKILSPEPILFSPALVVVLTASVLVKLWMCLFNTRLGKLIGSPALLAVAADSRNDCIATSAVLLSATLEALTGLPGDGWMGLAVALFILRSGLSLARETVSPLLGEGADSSLREDILDYIRSCPKVLGCHDLMVHDYGPGRRYASVHVEMDCREDPLECHEIIDDMERECLRSHNVHLVIHYDPIVTDDPELICLKEQAQRLLKDFCEELTLHDFRMVQGRRHMNLVFDVPLPQKLRGREEDIRRYIEEAMNGGARVYHVKITFDMAEN